jgi:hypothetical protein
VIMEETIMANDDLTRQDAGAEPVEDLDDSAIDSSQLSDQGADLHTDSPDGDKLPFDQHPKWKSARQTEKRVQEILADNEYGSLEDLLEDLRSSKSLREQVGNKDINDLLKAEQFKREYETWRAEQEIFKERPDELPEERAARLEQELRNERKSKQSEEAERTEAQKVERGWEKYNLSVDKYVDDQSLDADKNFVKFILDRDSDLNNVDVLDPRTTSSALKNFSKALEDYKVAIIKEYRDGKLKTPKITPVQEPSTALKDNTPKTLKEAHALVNDLIKRGNLKIK